MVGQSPDTDPTEIISLNQSVGKYCRIRQCKKNICSSAIPVFFQINQTKPSVEDGRPITMNDH